MAAALTLALAACGADEPGDVPPRTVATVPPPPAAEPPPVGLPHPAGVGPDGRCDAFDERRLRRLALGRAERLALRHGCLVRVAEIDGRGQALTSDLVPGRFDVRVRDGVVISVDPPP